MTPENVAVVFHVSELETAVKYYQDILGFKEAFRYGQTAGVEYGPVIIHLSGPGIGVNKRMVGQGHIYIFCDEVDEYFQDIFRKGALLIIGPDDRGYGMRDFAIRDPDGNILAFGKGNEKTH